MSFSIFESSLTWAKKKSWDIYAEAESTSTNQIAKQECKNLGDKNKLYLTDQQSQGRGRADNSWTNTPSGSSLLMSYSVSLDQPAQAICGPAFGLAVYKALKTTWPGLELSIKPPNDIYLKNKKIAGILLESVSSGQNHRLIFGLGLNVLTHPEQETNADSLCSQNGLGSSFEEAMWSSFLDNLYLETSYAIRSAILPELSEEDCDHLVEAINYCPDKPFTLLEVSPSGDLIGESETLSWETL